MPDTASTDWKWVHTTTSGGLLQSASLVDGVYPLVVNWDTRFGSATIPNGSGLVDVPGWAAYWQTSAAATHTRDDVVLRYRTRFNPGTFASGSPNPSNEAQCVWAWGEGNIMTSTMWGGFKYSEAWSFYALSLGADGAVGLWRKTAGGGRVRLAAAHYGTSLATGAWYDVEFQVQRIKTPEGYRGAALRGLVWPYGGNRPANWMVAHDDTSPLALAPPSVNKEGFIHFKGTGAYTSDPVWRIHGLREDSVKASFATSAVFESPLANGYTGLPLVPQPVVAVKNAFGSPEPSYDRAVTLWLCDSSGNLLTGTAALLLKGVRSATAISGRAVFAGITVGAAGTYRLRADCEGYPDPMTCLSTAFAVVDTGGGTGTGTLTGQGLVAFSGFPATGTAGVAVAPFHVLAKTVDGATDASYGGRVDLDVWTGPDGGTLSGWSRNATSGTARFTKLVFSTPGNYVLKAYAEARTPDTSGLITIAARPYTYEDPKVCTAWLVPRDAQYEQVAPYVTPSGVPWRIDDRCLFIPPAACEIVDNPVYQAQKTLSLSRVDVVERLDGGWRRTPLKQITLTWPKMGRELLDLLDTHRKHSVPFFMEFGGMRDASDDAAWTPFADPAKACRVYYGMERSWRPASVIVKVNGGALTQGFHIDHEAGSVTFEVARAPSDLVQLSYVWRPKVEVVSIAENAVPLQGGSLIVAPVVALREVGW